LIRLSLTKQLVELYKKSEDKYKDDLKNSLKEIEDYDKNTLRRKRINRWLENLEGDKLV
jgi:hypothetical protein